MALITLASCTGSPGTTTTAVALATSWPREVVLVDADRDPAQAIAAGYLMGVDLGGRGLASLARAHRERRPLAGEMPLHWVDVETKDEAVRHVVPGFSHPGAASLFAPVWAEFAECLAALAGAETDAIVDAGRVHDGLPAPLVARSDLLLLCVRSNLRSLASLRLHLPVVESQLAGSGGELGIVVVGPSRPYGAREIGQQFGLPVVAEMAWEPRQAAVYSDGAPVPRSLTRSALVRSARSAASDLDERLRRRADVVAGERDAAEWALS